MYAQLGREIKQNPTPYAVVVLGIMGPSAEIICRALVSKSPSVHMFSYYFFSIFSQMQGPFWVYKSATDPVYFNFKANTEHRIKHFAQINKRNYKLATTKCEDWRNVSKNKEQTHSEKRVTLHPPRPVNNFNTASNLPCQNLYPRHTKFHSSPNHIITLCSNQGKLFFYTSFYSFT